MPINADVTHLRHPLLSQSVFSEFSEQIKLRFRQRTRKSLWPSPVQNTHSSQNSWCDTLTSAEGGFQLQAPQAGQIKLLVSLSLRQGIANTFLPKMRSTDPTCRSYHELRIPES